MKRGKKFRRDQLVIVKKRVVEPAERDANVQYEERCLASAHNEQKHNLIIKREGETVKQVRWF